MKEVNYNINVGATVTLTSRGAEVINKFFKTLCSWTSYKMPFKTDYKEGDEFKSELWYIMHIFGSEMHMGCDTLFINNQITIIDELD